MTLLKRLLLNSLCAYGVLLSTSSAALETDVPDIGLTKIEALNVVFEQEHLCPYPIQFEVKVYNDLKIAGLKNFSYRWLINGDILFDNGRFTANPGAYGTGYDKQTIIVRVGNTHSDPAGEKMSSLDKVFSIFKSGEVVMPSEGWYQFLALPAGESNWYDAVKSNKASYKIICKPESY